MTLPKLEAAIVVPTGGYGVSLTDADGTRTVTLPAGTYFWRSTSVLTTAIKTMLDDGGGVVTYTVTLYDASDTSGGLLTLTASSGNPTITWTSTTLRDILGFTGASTVFSSSTTTGTKQVKGMWLPNTGWEANSAPPSSVASSHKLGRPVRPHIMAISPSGYTFAVVGATHYEEDLSWRPVWGRKLWRNVEVTTNESLEAFLEFNGPGKWLVYPQRSDTSNNWAVRCTDVGHISATNMTPPGAGSYSLWQLGLKLTEYL